MLDEATSNSLYAVAGFRGIFKSVNGGDNWEQLTMAGLAPSTFITNSGIAGQLLYALTTDGVYLLDTSPPVITPLPTVSLVSPNTLTGLPLPQTQELTITGSGFLPTSTLTFYDGVTTYPNRVPIYISPTELKYNIAVGTVAANWTVKVVNGTIESNAFSFYVVNTPDTTAPFAPIGLTSTPGIWTNNSLFYLDWTNPGDPSGIAKVWLKKGSIPISSTDGISFSLPLFKPLPVSSLSEGTETIYVWLEDGSGNKDHNKRSSAILYRDVTPPSITVTSPTTNNTYTSIANSIILGGNASDNLSGISTITWVNDRGGSGTVTVGGNWTTSAINLLQGANVITVVVTDVAGNLNTATITVSYSPLTTTYTLNVSATNGTVAKNPDLASYVSGSQVTLTGIPNNGYVFSGWSGDVSGTVNPLMLIMDSNKNIIANFTATSQTGTIRVSIVPQAASDAGAQWRLTNESTWRNSGTIKYNIPFGAYQAEFKTIPGWITPANKGVTISVSNPDIWINSDPYTQPGSINPPTNLQAVATSLSEITLTWNDNSSNEDNFKIEWRIGVTGSFSHRIYLAQNTTSWVEDGYVGLPYYGGLKPGTTYCYRVKAFSNTLGSSSPSSEACATPTTDIATTASPTGGTYGPTQSVTLTCNDGAVSSCASTYYTTDGSTPTTASFVYSAPITISVDTTLKFFSTDNAGNSEAVRTEVYIIGALSFYVGDGSDGALNISSSRTEDSVISNITSTTNSGQKDVVVNSATSFSSGDYILIIQIQGTGAGQYEFAKIGTIASNTLTMKGNLSNTYQSTGAQVIKVFQYSSVTINSGGFWTASAWDGTVGGVLVAMVSGNVTVNSGGSITMSGKGFRGGTGVGSGPSYSYQGESPDGNGSQSNNSNGSGGGGGYAGGSVNNGGGGAGGGHGTSGLDGENAGFGNGGTGGITDGSATLENDMVIGAGGGGSWYLKTGGSSGGIIFLVAGSNIDVAAGTLTSNGSNGEGGNLNHTSWTQSSFGAGGGAGGAIKLITIGNLSLGGAVNATGGAGGNYHISPNSGASPARGGNGGSGRIATLSGATITGLSTPVIDTSSTDTVTTVDPFETTPPTITSTIPINGGTNVAINTTITATFSEDMDASTINNSSFIMDNGVTGTVSYNQGTRTATFVPSTNLTYSTTYMVTITTGVKDLAGNNMASNYIWSFITGSVPDTTPPTTTANPAGGAYNSTQSVILTCNDGSGSGCASTYYTTDGSTPTASSPVYTGSITVSTDTTLKFFSKDNAKNSEAIKMETYTIVTDADIDSIPDSWEINNFGDLTTADDTTDYDNDGLLDKDEYTNNTDPKDIDTDNDGISDSWEVTNNLDPLTDDSGLDPDGDGYTNLEEYLSDTLPNDDTSTPQPDFGDAVDPTYPSLNSSVGANHLIFTYEWLGDAVDGEPDSTQVNADQFDDGVIFNDLLLAGVPTDVEVTVSVLDSTDTTRYDPNDSTKRLYLNAWFDWNGDGDWDDLGEKIIGTGSGVVYPGYTGDTVTIDPVAFGGSNSAVFVFSVTPTTDWAIGGYARFRLDYGEDVGTIRNLSGNLFEYLGTAKFGEVEDYKNPLLAVSTIDNNGGIITVSDPNGELDGAEINIPVGALTGPVDITIQEIQNPQDYPATPTSGLSIFLELGPTGTVFNTPATITVPHDVYLSHSLSPQPYFWDEINSEWSTTGIFNIVYDEISDPHTVTFDVNHFTAFGVGMGGNNPPSKPALVSPANGQQGLSTTVTFEWTPSTDPDGDPVTYDLYYCEDPDPQNNCVSIQVASIGNNQGLSTFYAKLGNSSLAYGAGLLLFGIILAGGVRNRKRLPLLMVMAILTGMLLVSCDGGGDSDDGGGNSGSGGGGTGTTNRTYTASNLTPNTQYYWQVVAKDGNGGETSSDVRSFTTQ